MKTMTLLKRLRDRIKVDFDIKTKANNMVGSQNAQIILVIDYASDVYLTTDGRCCME